MKIDEMDIPKLTAEVERYERLTREAYNCSGPPPEYYFARVECFRQKIRERTIMKDATSDGPYPAGERQGRSTFDKLAILCFSLATLILALLTWLFIHDASKGLPSLWGFVFIFGLGTMLSALVTWLIYRGKL